MLRCSQVQHNSNRRHSYKHTANNDGNKTNREMIYSRPELVPFRI